MANLFGTGINQVPTNGMLGSLAFQDKAYVAVDAIGIGTTFVDSGTASQPLQVAGGGYFSGSVGIGTTNPGAKLDVYGTSRFGGTTSTGRRVDITTEGIVTLASGNNANSSNLILQNASDTGATTNHGNSILWQFGTSTTTAPINAGEVKIAKELQWTTTATTQDAYFSISLALDGTVGEKLRVTSSGNLGIGTTNPSSQLHITGQFQSTQANSATTGGGQIYLKGADGNRIDFSTAGVAAPAFTTRSAGTKLVLYPSVGASLVDYALGIEAATLWSSVPDSSYRFKWYAGTTNIASLFGTGELVLGTTSLTGTASQPLQVTGGAYVSGNVGIGTTNPTTTLDVVGNVGVTTTTGDILSLTTTQTNGRTSIVLNTNGNDWEFGARGSAASPINSFYIYDRNASAYRQVIDPSGNIGIGTVSPASKLAVSGFITEDPGDGTFWNVVTQKDVGYSANQVPLNQYLGQLAFLDSYSPAGLRRTGGGSDDVVVSSTGLVGIGTASPTTTLDVVGSIKGAVTSGTVQASTAGTAINFTGIPSWVKRITVGFNAVKTSGTSPPLIQIGSSALGYTSTGYTGSNSVISNASAVTANFTNGIGLGVNTSNWSSSQVVSGTVTFVLVDSANNTWSASGIVGSSNATVTWWTAGAKSLATSNTLDRIRVTTSGGTETFAGGSINILYEG